MNTPAYADARLTLSTLEKGATTEEVRADASSVRPDALFLLNNLGIGGSERKIVRLANRLKEEGVNVTLACLNGPYTLESGIRRDVPCRRLERKGKFSFSALLKLREILRRERPPTVLAVNLYQALYLALATIALPYRPRTVALVNTSTFRGHSALEAHLPVGARPHRSHRARLECAARLLVQGELRGVETLERDLQRRRFRFFEVDRMHSKRRNGCAHRSASNRSRC